MEIFPPMVKHHGLHVGLKSRSFSESVSMSDVLGIHNLSRLAIRYQLRAHGSKLTSDEAQTIENKRIRLQKLIDIFENQADSFLLRHSSMEYPPVSSLSHYDEYDFADNLDVSSSKVTKSSDTKSHPTPTMPSDGSGLDSPNPEDLPLPLPSSLGWEWCVSHGVQSLVVKEVRLRRAQANDSIHRIRLALGFKSALLRSQVRPANTQQTKTRAWNAVHSVETTVHEHARNYSMACDACRQVHQAYVDGPEHLQLWPEDLHVATLVLGSEQVGQCNKQQSWIWGFGQTTHDHETYMDDYKFPCSVCSILLNLFIEQLRGFNGSVQRPNLKDG